MQFLKGRSHCRTTILSTVKSLPSPARAGVIFTAQTSKFECQRDDQRAELDQSKWAVDSTRRDAGGAVAGWVVSGECIDRAITSASPVLVTVSCR